MTETLVNPTGEKIDVTSSPPATVPGTKLGTSTTLLSSANPVPLGQILVITAKVVAEPSLDPRESQVPTGQVDFFDGTTNLGCSSLYSGIAEFSTVSLSLGDHSITAVYSGDTNFASSESAPLIQSVTAAVETKNDKGQTILAPKKSKEDLFKERVVSKYTRLQIEEELARREGAVIGAMTLDELQAAIETKKAAEKRGER